MRGTGSRSPHRPGRFRFETGWLLAAALTLAAAAASAQTTTGTLRGTVRDETGGVLPGTTIEAVNDASGVRTAATAQATGFYNLSLPPGDYTVTATLQSFAGEAKKVTVVLGQTQGVDFEMKLAAQAGEAVIVTASIPIIESKSNELATNVSQTQLETLPQDSRNFLKFAALAPGVRFNNNPKANNDVTFGALESFTTNVFIDGTSFKNDVLLGGVVGQDSSRGNPFPQNAVQEFRVVTQNFKAEYEKSSSGVITAVTKSGTNDLHGNGFAEYQNKSLVAIDACSKVGNPCNASPNETKPDFTRWQAGVDLGGPIVKDKVHFFASWELNDQNRANRVLLGGARNGAAPPELVAELEPFEGLFTSPFRSNLLFGKVSYQAAASDLIDTSGFWRHETDVKDFGDQRSLESATDVKQDIWNVQGRNTLTTSSSLSETSLSYQYYKWAPTAVNPGEIGLDYQNLLRIGGQDSTQNFVQKRFAVREDYSLFDVHFAGDHVVKVGAVANFNHYDVQKLQNANPVFRFRSDEDFAFPFEAGFGFGNPDLSTNNNQYGVYVQDDWTVNKRLTVNVGLRWDYETDDLNNDYVTPPLVVSELDGKVPPDYFTNGEQRPRFAKAFQPRVGFTYDLSGKGTTIVFGGFGIYYDRNYYNALLDERFRLQYSVLTFKFSADGAPRDGSPTIVWNPNYLSLAGLQGIIASGVGPKPEAFLIQNHTDPPVSNQWSFGFRQSFGMLAASISYAGTRSRNGFTFVWGDVGGVCCQSPSTQFQNVLLSDASKRYWYDALFLTLDKPYTASSKWGASVAYTYGHATQTGNDLFSLDSFGNGRTGVAGYPRHSTPTDERHRVVLSGIVGLPFDIKFSTFLTLSSGLPFTIDDQSRGGGPNERRLQLNQGRQSGTFPYQEWDLQLQKDVYFTQAARVGVSAGVFNVTDHGNYGCFDGFIPPAPGVNARFGQPGCTVSSPRRLQFGFNLGF